MMEKKIFLLTAILINFCILFSTLGATSIQNTDAILKFLRKSHINHFKLEGQVQESLLSKSKCIYTEWRYRAKQNNEWDNYSSAYRSETPLLLLTSNEKLEIPVSLIRPYLAPINIQVFTEKNFIDAPQPVQEAIKEKKTPVQTEEYCLQSGHSYFVKVVDGIKGVSKETLIFISDLPFKKGKPQRKLTPLYQQTDN